MTQWLEDNVQHFGIIGDNKRTDMAAAFSGHDHWQASRDKASGQSLLT